MFGHMRLAHGRPTYHQITLYPRSAGSWPGDILHNAYGYGLFTGGIGAHYGAERLGCTVVPISGGMTERQVQLINDGPVTLTLRQ